jgi:ATP-dependent Clp protease ATP-binding subunit ClpA
MRRGALRAGAAVAVVGALGTVATAPAALLGAAGGGGDPGPALEARLGARVFGQAGAIAAVAGVLRRSGSEPAATGRPAGCVLFVGPQGVGKTMLAREVARILCGSPEDLLRLDMAAYADDGAAQRLPGALNAGGGTPARVVLLDAIERAHPAVQDTLAAAFEGGRREGGGGEAPDVAGRVVIMSAGAPTATAAAVIPALRARIDAVAVFKPLDRSRLPISKRNDAPPAAGG